jgi:hypothetical protein
MSCTVPFVQMATGTKALFEKQHKTNTKSEPFCVLCEGWHKHQENLHESFITTNLTRKFQDQYEHFMCTQQRIPLHISVSTVLQ